MNRNRILHGDALEVLRPARRGGAVGLLMEG